MAKYPSRDTYDPEVAAEVCRRIANGETLRRICGPDRPPGVPERVTIYNWLHRHPPFMRAYTIARRAQAELYVDDMVEIADGNDHPIGEPRDVRVDWLRVKARHWSTVVITTKLYPGPVPEEPRDEVSDAITAARIKDLLETVRRRMELGQGPDPEDIAEREAFLYDGSETGDP